MTYTLKNVEEHYQENPETFWIPSKEDRESLQPGDHAKLIFFDGEGPDGERMWVRVDTVTEKGYIGRLWNSPIVVYLEHGDVIDFEAKHIIEIEKAGESKIVEEDKEPNIGYVETNKNPHRILHLWKTNS